jgi:hypothetical protein
VPAGVYAARRFSPIALTRHPSESQRFGSGPGMQPERHATRIIPGITVIGSEVFTTAAAGIDTDKNIASGWTAHYRLAIVWQVERL